MAIKQQLQQQLWVAVSLSGMGTALPNGTELTPVLMPLSRFADNPCVLYQSAIALKLAPYWQRPAVEIAQELIALLLANQQNVVAPAGLDFQVTVEFQGWITVHLSDRAIASWLQYLIQNPPRRERGSGGFPVEKSKIVANLFPSQYAHARCCSLLRLAHQQGLIELGDIDFQPEGRQILVPDPIPWLDEQGNGGQNRLRLVQPGEHGLIGQLLDLQDALDGSGQLDGERLAKSLGQAFEEFYRHCRIWGEVKTQTPKLAQARLGLVGVTQGCLRSLLEDDLRVAAPVEL